MTRAIFIFIAASMLLLPFILMAGEIPVSYQLIICTPFLLFLGIPHGAIDNVLYIRNNEITNFGFIGIYLLIIAGNILIWMIAPVAAYLIFLILSAYHFGQSQFSHYLKKQPLSLKTLYLLWGISIISGLVYLNIDEIMGIMAEHPEFAAFETLHQEEFMLGLLLGSVIITFFLMAFLTAKGILSGEAFLMEVLVLSLILSCLFLMPLLIGFTLYFVILHSFKVLREEYQFLRAENQIESIPKFVKLVTPFTLFSIAGIFFLFALIHLGFISMSYGYCLLIVISSITLPHVFVMNRFYNLIFRRNFSKWLA